MNYIEAVRENIARELTRLADNAEGMAAWTEHNFLSGPNSDYYIKHCNDMAETLREEASDWRNGYCDNFIDIRPDES